MTTSLEYFRIIAKQFSSVSDAEVNVWLDIAGLNANTACLMGDRANLALALYAAHLLSLDAANQIGEGGRGDILSEREGDLSRTYGAAVNDGEWIGQSPYGQQYANMMLGCFGATIMTRFGDSPPVAIAPYADDVLVYGPQRNLYD
jgi:hypothetical protein